MNCNSQSVEFIFFERHSLDPIFCGSNSAFLKPERKENTVESVSRGHTVVVSTP